jgi:hypothetical protein
MTSDQAKAKLWEIIGGYPKHTTQSEHDALDAKLDLRVSRGESPDQAYKGLASQLEKLKRWIDTGTPEQGLGQSV